MEEIESVGNSLRLRHLVLTAVSAGAAAAAAAAARAATARVLQLID